MAVNILNSTTLSEAVTKDMNEFAVASTSNIVAGKLIAIMGTAGLEMCKVQVVPVSGRVQVARGVSGTRALSHRSGARVFIGDHDAFISVPGTSPHDFIRLTGTPDTVPDYALPGARARDGAGNEYVLVELTATVVPGATLLISKDGNYTAGVLTSTGVGSVGIAVENGSSDQYIWAQVYGFNDHAKLVGGSSLVTSLGELGGATSVSTPAVGLLGRSSSQRTSDYLGGSVIQGMFPTSAASTASTSASSETGLFCSVFLDYPWVQRAITS